MERHHDRQLEKDVKCPRYRLRAPRAARRSHGTFGLSMTTPAMARVPHSWGTAGAGAGVRWMNSSPGYGFADSRGHLRGLRAAVCQGVLLVAVGYGVADPLQQAGTVTNKVVQAHWQVVVVEAAGAVAIGPLEHVD